MTISIPTHKENGKNLGNAKEMVKCMSVVVNCKDRGLKELITVRWYMGRSNSSLVVYCTIWLHDTVHHNSGHGKAGGGGYCKIGASFDAALKSAGIISSKEIYGECAVSPCLENIAQYLGYEDSIVINHG